MRALKSNACAGTEKPPAGLSEAPLGVSQRLSGAKNSMSFPWGAACGGHRYGCLGELGGRGQSLGPLGTGRCVSGMRACTQHACAHASVCEVPETATSQETGARRSELT